MLLRLHLDTKAENLHMGVASCFLRVITPVGYFQPHHVAKVTFSFFLLFLGLWSYDFSGL